MTVRAAATAAPAALAQARLLHGIDVVAVSRAAELLATFGETVLRRVATPGEAAWAGAAPERLAVLLGLKESAIKAIAGRPDGFGWPMVETGAGELRVPAPRLPGGRDGVPAPVRDTLHGFTAGIGLEEAEAVAVRLAPLPLQRALRLLPGGDAGVLGVGVFGVRDGHVFAATTFWRAGA